MLRIDALLPVVIDLMTDSTKWRAFLRPYEEVNEKRLGDWVQVRQSLTGPGGGWNFKDGR